MLKAFTRTTVPKTAASACATSSTGSPGSVHLQADAAGANAANRKGSESRCARPPPYPPATTDPVLADLPPALEDYAPIVIHDRRDASPLTSVAGSPVRVPGLPPPGGPPAAYAARSDGDDTILQYWLFLRRQPAGPRHRATGRHEGDWELVQVRLAGGAPATVLASQHSGAEACGWDAVRHDGTHPVVFVANGSHAGYFRPGRATDLARPQRRGARRRRAGRARGRVVDARRAALDGVAGPLGREPRVVDPERVGLPARAGVPGGALGRSGRVRARRGGLPRTVLARQPRRGRDDGGAIFLLIVGVLALDSSPAQGLTTDRLARVVARGS